MTLASPRTPRNDQREAAERLLTRTYETPLGKVPSWETEAGPMPCVRAVTSPDGNVHYFNAGHGARLYIWPEIKVSHSSVAHAAAPHDWRQADNFSQAAEDLIR